MTNEFIGKILKIGNRYVLKYKLNKNNLKI